MNAHPKPLVIDAVPGKVKLFAQRAHDGRYECFVSGGLLDGDRFFDEDLDQLLEGTVGLVQIVDRAEASTLGRI